MKNKIILAALIVSIIALIFSGCDGGNPIVPPINSEPLEGPYINNIDPSSGAPGIEVTINGGNFSSLPLKPTVIFGSMPGWPFAQGTVIKYTDTELVVVVPDGKNTAMVSVTVNFKDSNEIPFVYNKPIIERLRPSSGMPGTEVTIEGRDFGSRGDGPFYDPYCYVKFGKSFEEIIKWEDNEIVVEADSSYGTGIENVEFISNITSLAIGGFWGEIIKIFTGLFIPMVESPLGTIGGVSEEVQVATSAGTGKSVFTWGGEVNTLTPEEIELIRKWGYGGDYVVRWPDGYVGVYDETNYSRMQEVINEWNDAINGSVKFYLSSNPNSPVKVVFDSSLEEENLCYHVDEDFGENYVFSKIMLNINPKCLTYAYPLYLHPFNAVAGFNAWADVNPCPFDTWSSFYSIPDMIKTMVHALHKVPPGYYLGDSKQRKDHSNAIIKNVFTSGGRNCTDE